MTHGEKAKAKGKTSQASAAKKSSQKAGAKTVKTIKSGKAASAKSSKGDEGSPKKVQTGSPKGGAPAKKTGVPEKVRVPEKAGGPAKKTGAPPKEAATNSKGRPVTDSGNGGFSNPVVGVAFKRALKKYPNAFRKLTD